jgi:hypothetical protein
MRTADTIATTALQQRVTRAMESSVRAPARLNQSSSIAGDSTAAGSAWPAAAQVGSVRNNPVSADR